VRHVLGALLVAAIAAGAGPACKSDSDASADEADGRAAIGADISVSVRGRGRITSGDGIIDCPGKCFARAVRGDTDSAAPDRGSHRGSGPTSVPLVYQADDGAHFAGWKVEEAPMGVHVAGPSDCSPMTRVSTTPSFLPLNPVLVLPFGETDGSPPAGHETECANVRTVPLAYVVTATFEENRLPDDGGDIDVDQPPPPPTSEILFTPPPETPPIVAGREIGLVDGVLYWRVDTADGLSRILIGVASGGAATTVLPSNQGIKRLHVDQNALVIDDADQLKVIRQLTNGTYVLAVLADASLCTDIASNSQNAYCRAVLPDSFNSTVILSWPLAALYSDPVVVHSLPGNGSALATDIDRFYYSVDDGAGLSSLYTVPLEGDGGIPPSSDPLTSGILPPRDIVVGPSFAYWIGEDALSGISQAASASKFSVSGTDRIALMSQGIVTVAADPILAQYWIVRDFGGVGGASILLAVAGSTSCTVFRSNLTGVGGLVVDDSSVYWTQRDGNVYRAPKNGDEL
jgi:hypothetical protein